MARPSGAALLPGDFQYPVLQVFRQEEPGSAAKCFNFRLYRPYLASALCPQQDSKDAGDPQPGSLSRAPPISFVQQNQIRGQFQRQRDSLGLAGIEGCRPVVARLSPPEGSAT